MQIDGKLDYIELAAAHGTLDNVKAFYSAAFGWRFTDYGPAYSAFDEGLDGGFQTAEPAKPLPILFSDNLERSLGRVEEAGGRVVRPIFDFPGGRRFHFVDPAGNEMAVWAK